ncbi:competence ComEA-like helix-hairpin-helix protein [Pontibacter aydingkolensis]|uniref:Helix-hairpin-helix domain-containing protein n=1 Tax=Pontibacter aydingkolensis TaxID=1911536 RepID=A0ABS7CP55_9BACT|nr:helix-hairpin-helix domain-containing protein [Pontibacter aydingkolensis]MBW7465621.1 helix-hairpin-helix domain-containing protein [Pontibacter aydingkolensis]
MKKLRHMIRRHFGFSQREVNGFLWLITIMVLLTAAPFLFNRFYTPQQSINTATDRQLLDSLVAQLEAKQPERPGKRQLYTLPEQLQPFNPNQLTAEGWQQIGMPPFMAQRILNYRKKIGDFTYKAELGKIYGMPDSIFQQLYPYIQLPVEQPEKYKRNQRYASNSRPLPDWSSNYPPREKFILAPFNINAADTIQLKQIRGIGSKLSARIIKYRNSLGGFHSMAQVREVFGLPPNVVDSLEKYTFVPKANAPQKLNINNATADELRAHPYVTSNMARLIVAYREQHGAYKQVEDIRNIKVITQEQFEKLRPYLEV